MEYKVRSRYVCWHSSLKDIPSDDLRLVELAVPTEPVTVQVQIAGDKTP